MMNVYDKSFDTSSYVTFNTKLNDNLNNCTRTNVVRDTINVIEEFIKIYK